MIHCSTDVQAEKGWLVGPWNSDLPIPTGYAHSGIDEPHHHARMNEIYMVTRGHSTIVVDGKEVELKAGDILVVEPNERQTFCGSSDDYLHFVVHTPFVEGDRHTEA